MDSTQKFGRYVIRSVLGTGAMSIVYEGYDSALERHAAIKTVRKDLLDSDEADQIRERFRQEARIIARLKHRNFIGVFELAEDWDPPFIAMELISAKNLAQLVRQNYAFSRTQIAQIGLDLLDALAYLHSLQLVHRDIKPANLFWAPGEPLKVADLGVAHTESSTMTLVGATVGTPAYMAPEQFAGIPADGRIDLWAAGVVLYELLTMTRCFKGDQDTVRQAVVRSDPFESPLAQERIAGTAFEPVLRRALEKDREARFPDAAAFETAWRAAVQEEKLEHRAQDRSKATQVFLATPEAPQVAAGGEDVADEDATVLQSPGKIRASEPEAVVQAFSLERHRKGLLIAAAVLIVATGLVFWGTSSTRTIPTPAVVPIDVTTEIGKVIQTTQCSDIQHSLNGQVHEIKGFVPNNDIKAELQARLGKLVSADRLSLFTEIRPWPLCDVLQALKRYSKNQATDASGMHLRVQNYSGKLLDGDPVNLELAAPGFDSHIYVDYVQGDQNVVHLTPQASDRITKMNTSFNLQAGNVGSPFGDEMVVMIASRKPIFSAKRPEFEPADQYLRALRSELEKAQNGAVVADYIFIKTVPKK